MKWALLLWLAACKSQGTISLDFTLTGSGAGMCGSAANPYYVLYAEPQTSCDRCACGGCFGARADGVLVCSHCDSPSGQSPELRPGPWAIELELWNGSGSDNTLVASECIDAIIDADGTASRAPLSNGITCGSACVTGSSP